MFSRRAIYFDEVAKQRSVRGASDRLRIAPSAVDRQVLQLEQQLGTNLFERTTRGLRLTAAGELVLHAIRKWRREFDTLKSELDELQGLRRGTLSIGLAEGSLQFLSQCLKTFRDQYPGIDYRLHVAGSEAILDMVLRGDCDLGLTFNPPDTHDLRVEHALTYRLGAMMPPSHPLASRSRVSLAECADYPLIAPDDTLSLRLVINRLWHASLGTNPRFAVVTSSVSLMKAMILNGLGVGLLTAIDADDEIERGELVFRPFHDERVSVSTLTLIRSASRNPSAAASLIMLHLSAAMQSRPSVQANGRILPVVPAECDVV